MEWLTDWIGQIILFILMAVLIDLLIPNLSYTKYIKLVVGLILILILLSPVFMLFQLDMEEQISGWYEELFEVAETQSVENSIEIQKSDIELTQDAYILEEMAVQLKLLVEESLYEEHQAEITQIDFQFHDQSEKSYESLDGIVVFVQEKIGDEGIVMEVEEIMIPFQETEGQYQDKAIADLLRKTWELDDKEIIVYWEGGTS